MKCNNKVYRTQVKQSIWLFDQNHRREHNKGIGLHKKLNVSEWLIVCFEHSTRQICDCKGPIIKNFSYREKGPCILYCIIKDINTIIEVEINVLGEQMKYRLCGIIYFDSGHLLII